jgi:hypothetical protein
LWERLRIRCRHRLIYESSELASNCLRELIIRSADAQFPFAGLIHHLTDICGGNVHRKGVVSITCSSTEENQCWQVVDYDWTNHWYSHSVPNSWIQFDFKDRVVSLTHYSLKSHHGSDYWFVQWTLSGSTDGNSWTILDRRNTQDMTARSITKIFECNERVPAREFYRYIRLTQTGKNSSSHHHFLLTNIDLFGSMKKSRPDVEAIPQRPLRKS